MKENYITIGNRIQNNTLNPDTNKPYPNIDKNYGPYNSLDEALRLLPDNIRSFGLKFAVIDDNKLIEYRFNKSLVPEETNIKYKGEDLIIINENIIKFDNTVISKNDINIRYFGFTKAQMIKSNNEETSIYSPNGLNKMMQFKNDQFKLFYPEGDEDGFSLLNVRQSDVQICTKERHNVIRFNNNIVKINDPLNNGNYIKLGKEHVNDVSSITIAIDSKTVFKATDTFTSVQYNDNDILKAGNLDEGQGFELKCPNNINPVISAYDSGSNKNQVYIQYPNDNGNAIEIKYDENENKSSINIITDRFLWNNEEINKPMAIYDSKGNKILYKIDNIGCLKIDVNGIIDGKNRFRLAFKGNMTNISAPEKEDGEPQSYINIYNSQYKYNKTGIDFVGDEFRFNGKLFDPNNIKITELYNESNKIIAFKDEILYVSYSDINDLNSGSVLQLTDNSYIFKPIKLSNTFIEQSASDEKASTTIITATNNKNIIIECIANDVNEEEYIKLQIDDIELILDKDKLQKLEKLLK